MVSGCIGCILYMPATIQNESDNFCLCEPVDWHLPKVMRGSPHKPASLTWGTSIQGSAGRRHRARGDGKGSTIGTECNLCATTEKHKLTRLTECTWWRGEGGVGNAENKRNMSRVHQKAKIILWKIKRKKKPNKIKWSMVCHLYTHCTTKHSLASSHCLSSVQHPCSVTYSREFCTCGIRFSSMLSTSCRETTQG